MSKLRHTLLYSLLFMAFAITPFGVGQLSAQEPVSNVTIETVAHHGGGGGHWHGGGGHWHGGWGRHWGGGWGRHWGGYYGGYGYYRPYYYYYPYYYYPYYSYPYYYYTY